MASLTRAATLVAPRRLGGAIARQFSALSSPVEEFPGLPSTTPTLSTASSSSVTTLSSGLTIVSENASTTSTIALTFPNAGSSCETASESGAALANKCMAFKSGSGLSSALILRNLEDEGATPFASAGRLGASIGFTTSPDKAEHLIPLLGTNCTFEKWDMKDALALAKVDVSEAQSNAQSVLTDSIYAAAYGGQTAMGKPLYTVASASTIQSFRERTYVLSGAVLSATGISDHEAFVLSVEESFSEIAVGTASDPIAPVYLGGESRVNAPSAGYAHVALAFQGPSSPVLQNVLKYCLSISGASAFAAPGIIGVYGGADSAGAGAIVDSLCTSITTATFADVVERAKNLAKAEAIFALDGGSRTLVESMTSSVLETGNFSAAGLAASYDEITAADVNAAFSAAFASNPILASVGDITSVPYHATVASRFS
eukprot:CAMPEP_0197823614 /NCGR_PEP_ID=MMETSP1437-20131217/940_1 /TAXON_ID=49252 ORGANISM="Eucampia antarctica, Strain CCMP1452" /NCGR_SAMPLE_ID=MMETSP1437 /ASSEMBLY_ACC=CAM_ASM_001096 /LENGTH=429 /DNA_ID=CAMNT_0043422859 /DNA_START=23 /DNA_END=1312 /DNA_ORIENTATION=-